MTGNTCASTLPRCVDGSTSRGEHLVRDRRRVEPQRPQQLDRRLPVPAGPRRRGPGERLEQRPVEEPLVDLPDQRGLAFELGEQLLLVAHAERARQDGPGGRVGGELVGLQVAHDLQAMLERPEEAVRPAERGRVVATHVPLVREDLERAQRVRLAEPFVPPAVDDLQQLHRELDVADASSSALDLDVGLAGGADVLLEADLDASDLVDRRLGEHLGEHERGHGVDERAPELGFARDGSGLDQRLALPGRGLRLVVPAHRVERPRQRAARAARTERRCRPGGRCPRRSGRRARGPGPRSRARPPPAVPGPLPSWTNTTSTSDA